MVLVTGLRRVVAALTAIFVATAGAVLALATPAAAAGPDRFKDDMVTVQDGSLYVSFDIDAVEGDVEHNWGVGWVTLGKPSGVWFTGTPSVVRTPDGRLTVFAVAYASRNLWHRWQLCDGCAWSDWYNLGGELDSNPAAVYKPAQRVFVVFALARNEDLWHIWQVCPRCNWSIWTSLSGGPFTSYPIAGLSGDKAIVNVWHENGRLLWNWQVNEYPGDWHGWGTTAP
jgi:hypothetical protein